MFDNTQHIQHNLMVHCEDRMKTNEDTDINKNDTNTYKTYKYIVWQRKVERGLEIIFVDSKALSNTCD